MNRLPPRSTRTDTLWPSTPLFRSHRQKSGSEAAPGARFAAAASRSQHIARGHYAPLRDPGTLYRHGKAVGKRRTDPSQRSEEHTSELQSLMRISYAVFCLKKNTTKRNNNSDIATKTLQTATQ